MTLAHNLFSDCVEHEFEKAILHVHEEKKGCFHKATVPVPTVAVVAPLPETCVAYSARKKLRAGPEVTLLKP